MILARVEGRELRRHVVRIDRVDSGGLLGTGFFVAPGWVLTCAHVVDGVSRATLVPDPELSGPVTATVMASSPAPVSGVFWPFPDLALLRLDSDFKHPCVLLAASDPDNAQDCFAWGYPQQQFGQQEPPGAPAAFRFEGRQDDGYLKLSSGQAAPGLSGAPLVCPYRRAVVGVISVTRNRETDLGAWASPIDALLNGGPGVPDELAGLGPTIREANRAAVLADRAAWHRVLPFEDATRLLDRPWGPFLRQQRSSPADLLRADFGVVPYLFRDTDLNRMIDWCENDAAEMSVAMVVGHGGAGKTRFAIELCERMIGRHWTAGLWPNQASVTGAQRANAVINLPLPRLIVIDYAEASAVDTMRDALDELRARATALAPIRILLLVRTATNAIRDLLGDIGQEAPGRLRTVLDAAIELGSPTEALVPAQRQALYTEAVERFRHAWFIGPAAAAMPPQVGTDPPDLSDDHYALPLEVLFEAFDHAMNGNQPASGDRLPVERALTHERKYWDATAPVGLDPQTRYQCVALATLAGAADEYEAHTLLVATIPVLAGDTVGELRTETIEWLANLYPGAGLLNPLRPDRLGEALVVGLLDERRTRWYRSNRPGTLLGTILTLPGHHQVATCLDTLARLTNYDSEVGQTACAVLAELHAQLVARAEAQGREQRDQPGRLTVTSGLIRLLAGDLGRHLIDTDPGNTAFQSDLSTSFTKIGDLAASTAQNAQAERLYRYGLQIRERLTAVDRGRTSYQFDLAVSYDRLGGLAHRGDQGAKAAQLYRQAIAITEAAIAREPASATYRYALSDCYGRLGVVLRAAGRADEAQDCSLTAVRIHADARNAEAGRTGGVDTAARTYSHPAVTTAPPTTSVTPTATTVVVPRTAPSADRAFEIDTPPPLVPVEADADIVAATGKVVTFYSYKGGTGRSMALANIAWILAANGKRVLITDCDLESPGLHRYFRPFLEPTAISTTPGVIEMVREYRWVSLSKEPRPPDWHLAYARVKKYAMSVEWDFPNGGRLDFLSAGRQNQDYSNTVASVNWDEFYEVHHGGAFFDALREDMRANYDYALIDSRTGLSDVADICTVHLPDILVDCFTLSDQGVEGAAAIARGIAENYSERGIRILPVPMRVDESEREVMDRGRAYARNRFDQFPQGLTPAERTRYWGSVEIPYRPFYAYEEKLATFGDEPGTYGSLLSSMERLTEWITDGEVTSLPMMNTRERLSVLSSFTRERLLSHSDLVLAFVPEDRMWAEWIAAVLDSSQFTVRTVDVTEPLPPDLPEPVTHQVVALISPAFARSRAATEFAQTVATAGGAGSLRQLIPIMVRETWLGLPTEVPAVDLTAQDEMHALESVLRAVEHLGPTTLDSAVRFPGPIAPSTEVRFPGTVPVIWNAPVRNSVFTGRNAVLEALRGKLASSPVSLGTSGALSLTKLPVVLHGLGGVGKTQLALEYAHRFKADYDVIWWVDASQPEQIDRSLAELAHHLNLRAGENHAEAACEALAAGTPYRRWLLIFDNAEDPAALRRYLPGGPGQVLITSPFQSWADIADPLEVDVFARAESTEHLLLRVPALTPAEAQELAETLGDLPLAIEVAGAWLADSGLSVASYFASLRRSTDVLSQSRPTDYPRSLDATWKISLDRLAARSAAAVRLLELCSLFAPEISIELIYSPETIEALLPLDGSLRVPSMLGRVIQEISRLALAKEDRQRMTIRVHRLVQVYLRDQMDAEKIDMLVHRVHRILAAARPQRGDTDDPRNWPQYQLIWPHLMPSNAARCDEEPVRQLLIDRVCYLQKCGDYERGISLAREVEGIWSARLAGELDRTVAPHDRESLRRQLLHLQSQRANIYRSQGEITAALTLDQAVLQQQQRILPQGDLHTLITASGMAADLRSLGRFAEALTMDQGTYRSLREIFGVDHERTLAAANDLGVDYRLNGDCFTARTLDQDTLARRREMLGPAHPHTLTSALNLARDHCEAGEYQQSITILQATYTEFTEVLSESFEETLRTATSLGTSLRYAGQYYQARALTQETYARYEEEFHAETPDAYACRLNLAADLAATGEIPGAIDLTRTVHASYSRQLGEHHPFTLAALNNLAVYLGRGGSTADALHIARQCVDEFIDALGAEHRYTITAQVTLANSLAAANYFHHAAELDEEIHPRLVTLLGDDHPTALIAGLNLANSLAAIGSTDRAQALRRQLLPHCARKLGQNHPVTHTANEGGRIDRELEAQPL